MRPSRTEKVPIRTAGMPDVFVSGLGVGVADCSLERLSEPSEFTSTLNWGRSSRSSLKVQARLTTERNDMPTRKRSKLAIGAPSASLSAKPRTTATSVKGLNVNSRMVTWRARSCWTYGSMAERASRGTAEDESAGGGQHSVRTRLQDLELPLELSGGRFQRADRGIGGVAVDGDSAASREGLARDVFRLTLVVDRAHLAGKLVEQLGLRAVGRAVPVRGARDARKDRCALDGGLVARLDDRPPLGIEAVGPGLLREWRAREELARFAVEHVIECVAVRLASE